MAMRAVLLPTGVGLVLQTLIGSIHATKLRKRAHKFSTRGAKRNKKTSPMLTSRNEMKRNRNGRNAQFAKPTRNKKQLQCPLR
jgi:Na+/glutamate symporter